MNNTEYGKTTEKLRNRTDVGLESNKKGFVKRISKPGSMTKKVFSNSWIVIPKVTLRLD